MTTGQRIAAKRKEYKLSQEALGEQLGVSRQSIYKWESDASLPEIDKLVAMSRLFSVSVGWLLGVEGETPAPETEAPEAERTASEPENRELTPAQLTMVEEIVGRYLAAQPAPKKRKKWPYVLAALILFGVGSNLFDRLERLDNRYNTLQNSISNISSNVNSQINTITKRVEEVLKAQNDLTADYGTQYTSADLAANTVTFALHATPKTYTPGMEVIFQAEYDDGQVAEVTAEKDANNKFSANLTCPLTNSITLSAVLVNGDTRQTQILDNYSSLYNTSLPRLDLQWLETAYTFVESENNDGIFHLPEDKGRIDFKEAETEFGPVEVSSIRVGLFRNGVLVRWLDQSTEPEAIIVNDEQVLLEAEQIFIIPEMDIELDQGDILHFAAIFTDEYGRKGVAPSIPAFECMGDEISWGGSSDVTPYFDIENYTFDLN